MTLSLKVTKKISRFLEKAAFRKELANVLWGTRDIVVEKYKREIPVDRNLARNSVSASRNGDVYTVTTTATSSRGFRYPLAVATGTGRYKNSNTDVGRISRVRKNYSKDDRKKFAGMAKRGVKFHIKPNMFATRAAEQARQPVLRFVNKEVIKRINAG